MLIDRPDSDFLFVQTGMIVEKLPSANLDDLPRKLYNALAAIQTGQVLQVVLVTDEKVYLRPTGNNAGRPRVAIPHDVMTSDNFRIC